MNFIWQGIRGAWHLLINGDSTVVQILEVTLRVAIVSTLIAMLIGLPIGLVLGLARFRGRTLLLTLANAGLGLPPVVVGLIVSLLLFRGAPLGGLHWIYTVNGVIAAQTVLALPVIAAFTAAAVQQVDPGLLLQARALGASTARTATLALLEARVGIIAAVVAALGSALSEVGAVVLVGGNIDRQTQTLASALLVKVSAGDYAAAIALGVILLGLVLLLSAFLTAAQPRVGGWRPW